MIEVCKCSVVPAGIRTGLVPASGADADFWPCGCYQQQTQKYKEYMGVLISQSIPPEAGPCSCIAIVGAS